MPGFRASSAASGMKYRDREDLALWVADGEASAAGVFTRNRFCAAPVEVCRDHLKASGGRAKAVVVNAGVANACTGQEGVRRAEEMTRMVGDGLGVSREKVLVCSTGVIGPQVSLEPVAAAVPRLVETLEPDGWDGAARAIMTTDTFPKRAWARARVGDRTVTVGGVAKGSGMIAPDMATMLAFVCTDAAVEPGLLGRWAREGADRSFNRITVDGDTSTNDTLILLAGGSAGNPSLGEGDSPEARGFFTVLEAVLLDLAKQIVEDGEGATKFVEIRVSGAKDEASARAVAFTVAHSPLVKTAFFGEDANWGRVVAAAGRSGAPLDPSATTLFFEDCCVFRNGTPVEDPAVEEEASRVLRNKRVRLRLDLGMGPARFTVYTSDLSYDYVRINADYRS